MNNIYENLELLPEDLQGWHGNDPIFEKLILEVKPKHIIEVGTWKGQSAINMGKIIKKHNLDCKITCVDTWLGSREFIGETSKERNLMLKNGYPMVYFQFLSNVVHNGLEDVITPFPQVSLIASKHFADKKISADMIYIDASHEFTDVLNDFYNYRGLLNDNGIMFGDDYKIWSGVTSAINHLIDTGRSIIDIENQFWIYRKNKNGKYRVFEINYDVKNH